MPTYEYHCPKCGRTFSLALRISEHDKKRVRCPKCHSAAVTQKPQSFFATTAKKS